MTKEKIVEAKNWMNEHPVMIEQGYVLEERQNKVVWVMYIEEE